LFLLCSHREVASFAVIEALAFGVTPVVSDIPAFRALTGAGAVGALFPPGDAPALARALVALAPTVGPSSRGAVQAHFARTLSWPAIGRAAIAIYRRLQTIRALRVLRPRGR